MNRFDDFFLAFVIVMGALLIFSFFDSLDHADEAETALTQSAAGTASTAHEAPAESPAGSGKWTR